MLDALIAGRARQTRVVNPQAKVATMAYDAAQNLTRVDNRKGGGAAVVVFTYTYDRANRRTVQGRDKGSGVSAIRIAITPRRPRQKDS